MTKEQSPTGVRPIVRQRLSDILVGRIHDHIVQHRLNPGDRLPTEQEMAKQFGVSRLAVREATKALGFLGIIESSPRRGVTVGTNAFERVMPLLKLHPTSRDIPQEELIATRLIIETGAVPYVIEKMKADKGVYDRLTEINSQMEASNTLDLWIHYDITFHNAFLRESGLRVLVTFGEMLQVFFYHFRRNIKPDRWKIGPEKHRAIIELLRKGDVQEATEEVRAHISYMDTDSHHQDIR